MNVYIHAVKVRDKVFHFYTDFILVRSVKFYKYKILLLKSKHDTGCNNINKEIVVLRRQFFKESWF